MGEETEWESNRENSEGKWIHGRVRADIQKGRRKIGGWERRMEVEIIAGMEGGTEKQIR